MKATMTRADFYELRFRNLEADVALERLRQAAAAIEAKRDAVFAQMGDRYGFDWRQPFTLEDDDYTLTQPDPEPAAS